MVLGALTIELFFKCLICMQKGDVPHTHHLRELFDMLAPETQSRILREWEPVAQQRAKHWDATEKVIGMKIARDLPSALVMASKAFEQIRYSYEGIRDDVHYYLDDLPRLLGRVILQIKPEWTNLRRVAETIPPPTPT